MVHMLRLIIVSLLTAACLFAQNPISGNYTPDDMQGMSKLVIKSMATKDPDDLEPKMAIFVGNMFDKGMPELNIKVNKEKAVKYYTSGAKRGQNIGLLLLANLYLGQGKKDLYMSHLEKLMKKRDKLSANAGIMLAGVYAQENDIAKSMEVLQYVSNMYDDARAQFMVGWAIVTNKYIPKGMNRHDGEILLNMACSNPNRNVEIEQKCKQMF